MTDKKTDIPAADTLSMVIKSADLETVCGITSTLPGNARPEIAFAGKSNVGKSSLINRLLARKSLARTSSSPGKTQTINFYRVKATDMTAAQREREPERQPLLADLYFVDLPGYGYARANEEAKAAWGKLIERYLHTSKALSCVFLLIDIRHKPGENDILMYDWICRNGYQPVIIATKSDKVKRGEIARQVKLIRQTLGAQQDTVIIPFSAVDGTGTEKIWAYIVKETGSLHYHSRPSR